MKIIKTALGWEIQPQTDDERYHLSWFIDWVRTGSSSLIPIVEDENVPVGLMVTKEMLEQVARETSCPRCYNFGCYNGTRCSWCGHETTGNTSRSNFVRCVE